MLNSQQQQLIQAIERLEVEHVSALLAQGLDPNFIALEQGPPVSVLCDRLFVWWETICEAYNTPHPLSEIEKQQQLEPYLCILDALIHAGANLHLWDSEEFYGPLWDAASAACVPVIQRLLEKKVNPNTLDEQGLPILSSISQLWFECEFDAINWQEALAEERATLHLLRENGAKMAKEL